MTDDTRTREEVPMAGGLKAAPLAGEPAGADGAARQSLDAPDVAQDVAVGRLRLGNRLRVARAELRLSQEALATLAGVTRQTIGAIENEQYCPSALLAFVLARCLGKPVADVFFLEEGPR
jgi:putative transcriptional regulator